MKKISILCLTLLSFLFAQSQMKYLKGRLQGSQQTPPNAEAGSGVVIVEYDMSTKALKSYGDYAGLSTPITMAHIHRGEPGVAGPIVVPLNTSGGTTGALTGTDTLTQALEDSLLAGNMYANVHTDKYPAGELRAQLTVTTGVTTFLSGKLQGAQEIPPTSSSATGSVYALVDMGNDSVYLTGTYTGLTAASTLAHVHSADPGSPGNVIFPIYHSSDKSGALHADVVVTAAFADSIATGRTYVNVHTSTYGNGEIRAQLWNNTGVRYFAGELSGLNIVPPFQTAARGTVIVTYNTETNYLQLAGDYQKLSDNVSVAEVRAGAAGAVGDPVLTLTTSGDSTGTLLGTGILTDNQELDLLAGDLYVNVQTNALPGGEIRTQLMATTGETHVFAVNLDPGQVAKPPITGSSSAFGKALVIMDRSTGMIYATGAFQGINSNAISAHIHRGPVGDTSAIIVPLSIAQRAPVPHAGTFSGSGTLSASLIDSVLNGLAYIDIHSSRLPFGAIRAQLGDLVLPLKLTYFNAYKQQRNIQLVWETSEELNVSRYEVEQLNTTTKQWATKGVVPAKGGSSATTYNFTDVPATYGSAYVLYRLKIVDKDNKITYSYLVKVNFEKLKAELFIQTNPVVNGELKYTITGLSTDKKAEVSIIDFNGKLLLKNTVSSLSNNTIKIHQLSAGMYKLIVRIDDTVLQKSFIK